MELKNQKKLKDLNWFFYVPNVVFYGYQFLKPRVRFTYICLLSLVSNYYSFVPSGEVISTSQRRLARAFQMNYSTFRSHLKDLSRAKLISVCKDGIHLEPFLDIESARALKVKYKFVENKNNKFFRKETGVGYTMVPKSIVYGYPDLNPGAKFLYSFLISLDWSFKGYEWHGWKKLTRIIDIKLITFKNYLSALNECKLTCVHEEKFIGDNYKGASLKFINRKERVYYNSCSKREQERAKSFRLSFDLPLSESKFSLNAAFDLRWSSFDEPENVG